MATTTPATPESPGTNTQGLAPWAAPYITNYLGQAQALSNMPYQTYQGPLTAGTSPLQQQAFQGIGALTVPEQYSTASQMAQQAGTGAQGLSFSPTAFSSTFNAPGAYTPVGGSFTDQGVAQQYMNPYLQQALNPQLAELQRQSAINLQPQLAKLTGAGGYGGSREALLRSEAQRNLMDQMDKTLGQGYSTAYQQGMGQFNTEQQRKIQEAQFAAQQGMTGAELAARYGLEAARAAEQSKQFGAGYGLDTLRQQLSSAQTLGQLGQQQQQAQLQNLGQQLTAGDIQRSIEQQGVTADLNEFNAQREFPYKQVQFQRDMISGLPIGSVSNTPAGLSGIAQLLTALGGADKVMQDTGQSSLTSLLSNLFGLNLGGGATQ